MQQIISDIESGTINIFDKFDINAGTASIDYTPYFHSINSEYIISFVDLQNVIDFSKFSYDVIGTTEFRTLNTYYRASRDGNLWTKWIDLLPTGSSASHPEVNILNFPIIDSKDPLFLDVKWVRTGDKTNGDIRLLGYNINGRLERLESNSDIAIKIPSGSNLILAAPFIYKVFKITDVEVISPSVITNVEIKYRYSQDNSRTWSGWEFFTKENITTRKINPVRFFQIEYSVTNNSGISIIIQDINLIGDFQNVSKDYFKSNLFGIRECCASNILGTYDSDGNFVPPNNNGSTIDGQSNETGETGVLSELSTQDKANLYNPYQQNIAVDLLSKLSTDAEQIFGHKVIYFVTDPDKMGQDHTLHEYQLYNVVCEANIKVAVEGNNFPDSQIVMNQFDLSLFESMSVNITKKQFKESFGPQRRPSKEDFIYFCEVNRMFQVDHAQQFRNFNNAAVYYKLVLKKYTQKSNVQAGDQNIGDKIKNLTKNSTINELFGIENEQDKASVANKDQQKTLSRDPIRLEYFASIDRELIENSTTIISKSNYDLSTVTYQSEAIKYKNFNNILRVSDNIGYQTWFKINNYISGETYSFISYYDDVNSKGWKANFIDDSFIVKLNSDSYTYSISGTSSTIDEDVWYCYVLNVDQRNRKVDQFIYKRNTDDEDLASLLKSTVLKKVFHNSQAIIPIEYELEDQNLTIVGSDMRVTNIRLFTDIIPESTHNKILNQYIIRDDSKYLVFADNSTTRILLPYMPIGNE